MTIFHAPLAKQLLSFVNSDPTTFHVPGHHYGRVLQKIESEIKEQYLGEYGEEALQYLQAVMRLDTTELNSTDDLHDPVAAIAEAQQLAAQTFGAEQTHFLVGGSSAGNIALILATCNPGDTVIVQRNVHKSIINGLKLAGARAVFLMPQYEPVTNTMTIPSLEQVGEALRSYPDAKAVLLTNPNYYGIGYRLERWVELVHRYHIPLIVDEAHGAHYSLHPLIPSSALQAGADAVIQSTHKTLTALTMSAMLHLQGTIIDREQVASYLTMIQSSSPSFPQMISLDIARAIIDIAGEAFIDRSIKVVDELVSWIAEHAAYIGVVSDTEVMAETKNCQKDRLRLLLYDQTGHYSGYQLQQLFEQDNCWAEMADLTYVVLVVPLGADQGDMDRLKQHIKRVEYQIKQQLNASDNIENGSEQAPKVAPQSLVGISISAPVLFERQKNNAKSMQMVHLYEAIGKEAAEAIIPYPPGIPIVYEGEVWTNEHYQLVQQYVEVGAKFQGSKVGNLQKVKIYDV